MSISFSKCSPAQNPKLNFHPPMSNSHVRTSGNQVIICAPVLVPTNRPLRASACSPAQNAKPVVNRPTADFSPSMWGERFISYTPADEIARAHKEKQVEDLRKKVRRRLIAASLIARLMDDMATHKFEQERGHVASAIECYMKQYTVSEQQAYEEFNKRIANAWRDINQGFLRPTSMPVMILNGVLNLTRAVDVTYREHIDEFTQVGNVMKDNVASLLIDPVPV